MNLDDFIGYMYTSGKLDGTFGLKDDKGIDSEVPVCPECGRDLLVEINNKLYCKRCNISIDYNSNRLIKILKNKGR